MWIRFFGHFVPIEWQIVYIRIIFMSEKIIAVDIDEVLSETMRSMLKIYNKKYPNHQIEWNDITDYNIWDIEKFHMTQKQSIMFFARVQFLSWIFHKINPVVWSKEKILELKSKWYKIYAVTARLSLIKISTKLWLRKYFKWCFEWVVFADFFTSRARKKSDICKEIEASIVIEDNLETCIDCANQWLKCYLFDKPRNQCDALPDWITRVYSWDEIKL